MEQSVSNMEKRRLNEDLIKIFDELKGVLTLQGDPFRGMAYQNACDAIIKFDKDIYDPEEQLKNVKGIGESILKKISEFKETGTLKILERERNNPLNVLIGVYGIGPKKAKELIEKDIKNISDLMENKHLLNDRQLIGLKYYKQIQKRIPRNEIVEFQHVLNEIFQSNGETFKTGKFNIVGSFRRGNTDSGDIDVIVSDSNNSNNTFNALLDKLIEMKIIVEVLSRGTVKCLTIVKTNFNGEINYRRADFLFSKKKEYAFAELYFTGSKIFNTLMRQRALDIGYTLNEHGISIMNKGIKGNIIEHKFETEQDIFSFLGINYKIPEERKDGKTFELLGVIKEKNETKSEGKIDAKIEVKAEDNSEKRKMQINHNKTFKIVPNNPVKTQIQKIKENGITVIKLMTENELGRLIHKANQAYYCDDKPILDDNLYDTILNYMQEKYPDNKIAFENHTQCDVVLQKSKAKLPYELWSMNKIKANSNSLEKWMIQYKGPYVYSCKLDGVSGLYVVKNGKRNLYTRGNGIVGQDISHMIDALGLVDFPDSEIAIRGEFIIDKNLFKEKYGSSFSNARNFVAGVINQKTPDKEKLGHIDFVAYELVSPKLKPSDQMAFIRKNASDMNLVKYDLIDNTKLTNEYLCENLLKWRHEYKYEIDGIIIVDDNIYERPNKNPDYAIAFKMVISDQQAETRVVDILWTPSKDGYIKPRIQIEPVILGGAKIEFATGFNAKFVVDNKIGIGSIISLVRSGDVIPHIEKVISHSDKACLPNVAYKWSESGVDIIIDNKSDNEIVQHKNITGFFKQLEVEGLASGNVKKLMDAGFNSIPKIIAMSKADFLKVNGFKDKLSEKIYTGIRGKTQMVSLPVLMSASNLFGRGMGEKRFKAVLSQYSEILTMDTSCEKKVDMLMKIDGFARKTAEKFVDGIPVFTDFIKEANLIHKLNVSNIQKEINVNESASSSILSGKKIVMTGFRDKQIMKWIENNGGTMASSVSSSTHFVLVKDLDEITGKADQARDLGITLMTADEFSKKYMI